MWQCNQCRELLEDQFDACWKCGCSRAANLATDMLSDSSNSQLSETDSLRFIEQYRCAKCGHDESVLERIEGRGTGHGHGRMLAKDFLAVSCDRCGYAEFYNLSILEQRTGMQNFFRQLFRS
ncbi:zinc ribbon domain-containing protein [Aeoliella mucimassa]|uniref:Uncharacterized protein n=1 Tax=Aeoliella mucimassa TaxID=2527972 RepID=A0A518AHZ5_9BACT|nr:zinc ribbon domain-containing protein [Aeoliella mucimassa]QDU54350.1 hypothetical protein Pan181_05310 [Aeoliella mucimassa]